MSIPGMDMVMLGDQPPRPSGHASPPRERGYVYRRIFGEAGNMRALRAFVGGPDRRRVSLAREPRRSRDHADPSPRKPARGAGNLLYCAQRGEMSASGGRPQGLQTVILTDCPDRNMRLGIWFGPDPDPSRPPAERNLTSAVADENGLRSFLSHFRFRGAAS